MKPFDVITFDCYGTLIDWESGIRRAFEDAAAAAGRELPEGYAVSAHAEIEPQVEAAGYRSYREVLTETAMRAAAGLGWRISRKEAGFLAASVPSWPPFPDTNGALLRMADAGHALGILSNVDDALLEATRQHFPVHFDLLVTAEQVRSYKPAHPHFLAAKERIGGRRWLHAAQSDFHDVVPARQLGIPVAWINRKGERAGREGPPLHETRDLAGLANWLTGD
ncbi:MAG: HAD family hydrolase [Thermoanaerobaculia bacterium]